MKDYLIYMFLALVVLSIICSFEYLILKRKDKVSEVSKAAKTVDMLADCIDAAVPGLPYMSIICKITEWCKIAAEFAEQDYKETGMKLDTRSVTAKDYVYKLISASGIELTDKLKDIISGAIKAAVLLLPKTHSQ